MLQIRNFRVILQVLLHIVGQSSFISADSDGDLDGVAGGSSDLVQNDAQTVDVVIQHLQDAVDVQVSDVTKPYSISPPAILYSSRSMRRAALGTS